MLRSVSDLPLLCIAMSVKKSILVTEVIILLQGLIMLLQGVIDRLGGHDEMHSIGRTYQVGIYSACISRKDDYVCRACFNAFNRQEKGRCRRCGNERPVINPVLNLMPEQDKAWD